MNDDYLEIACRIAERSPHKRYGMGCVFVSRNEVLAVGWSHPSIRLSLFSCHAEQHALYRVDMSRLQGATAYIAAVSKKSGNRTCARPCQDCVRVLSDAGLSNVWYTTTRGSIELDLATYKDQEFKNYRGLKWKLA